MYVKKIKHIHYIYYYIYEKDKAYTLLCIYLRLLELCKRVQSHRCTHWARDTLG